MRSSRRLAYGTVAVVVSAAAVLAVALAVRGYRSDRAAVVAEVHARARSVVADGWSHRTSRMQMLSSQAQELVGPQAEPVERRRLRALADGPAGFTAGAVVVSPGGRVTAAASGAAGGRAPAWWRDRGPVTVPGAGLVGDMPGLRGRALLFWAPIGGGPSGAGPRTLVAGIRVADLQAIADRTATDLFGPDSLFGIADSGGHVYVSAFPGDAREAAAVFARIVGGTPLSGVNPSTARADVRAPGTGAFVVGSGRISGTGEVVFVGQRAGRAFAPARRALAWTLAAIAVCAGALLTGGLLLTRRLVRAGDQADARSRHLLSAAATLSGAVRVEDVAESVTRIAPELVDATAATLVVEDGDVRRPWFARATDYGTRWPEIPDDSPIAEAIATDDRVLAPDARAMATRYPEVARRLAAEGLVALAAVPLPRIAGGPRGALSVAWTQPVRLTAADWHAIEELAEQASHALARAALFEAEAAARTRAELLEGHAERLAAGHTPEAVGEATAATLTAMGMTRVGVHARDGRLLRRLAARGDAGPEVQDLDDATPAARAARDGDEILAACPDDPARDAVALPVRGAAGRVLGAIVAAPVDRAPGRRQRELLAVIAEQSGLALDRALLARREALRHRRAEELQALTGMLAAVAEPSEMAQLVAEHAHHVVDSDAATLGVVDETRGVMVMFSGARPSPGIHARWTEVPLAASTGPTLAAASRAPVVLATRADVLSRFPVMAGDPACAGLETLVAVPVEDDDGRVLGALACWWSRPGAADADVVQAVEVMARRCAQPLRRGERARENRRMRRRSELTASILAVLEREDGWRPRCERLVRQLVPAVADVATIEDPSATDRVVAEARDGAWAGTAPHSQTTVPLRLGAEPGDALTLALGLCDPGRRPYSASDAEFLRDLAAHAALPIATARLLDQERRTALHLQRSLLPAAVIEHPQVRIAARYAAADTRLEVGGDWYDSLVLADGTAVIAVGDVVGHGMEAAAAMGRLRTAFCALAPRCPSPGALLAELEVFARGIPEAHYSSLCCCFIEPMGVTVSYACAGHPPPLVLAGDGTATFATGGTSWPLCVPALPNGSGTDHGDARPEGTLRLHPGGTLVLYSDGLVERRDVAIDDRLEELRVLARDTDTDDPERLCDAVLEGMTAGRILRDDVVVVAVRVHPDPSLAFYARCLSRPGELSEMRRRFRRWADEAGIEEEQEWRLTTALGEATANAVEHAYRGMHPGPVDVLVFEDAADGLRLVVRDAGAWRPPVPRRDRGRGTAMMRRLSDAFERTETREGTEVRMGFRGVRSGTVPVEVPGVGR